LRKDQEPAAPAGNPAPLPPVRESSPATPATPAAVAPPRVVAPAPEIAIPTPEPEREYASGFGQGMLAAPAPMTEGEVIEIDESKLGLSDFHEHDEPASAFSITSLGGARPAANRPTEAPAAAIVRPMAAPVEERRVAPAPAAPGVPPTPDRPVASAATPPAANPHAAAAAHAAVMAQRAAAAARAAAAQSAATPTNVSEPQVAPAAAPTAPPATSPAATTEGEALDPAKEREAALFRLRMRAMMSRLRTDEQDEPKGSP
ncbi:MAG TPA: hypothetical protein VN259_03190, partial [Xanthomonadales bacterium]|nr:hypothetical protein [Xanthomonadales bacterium]